MKRSLSIQVLHKSRDIIKVVLCSSDDAGLLALYKQSFTSFFLETSTCKCGSTVLKAAFKLIRQRARKDNDILVALLIRIVFGILLTFIKAFAYYKGCLLVGTKRQLTLSHSSKWKCFNRTFYM